MTAPPLRLFVCFLLACGGALAAHAQTVPIETIDSLDLKVLNAERVVVGTIVGVAEGARDVIVTLGVEETLKGKNAERIEFKAHRWSKDQFDKWQKDSARLLIAFALPPAGPEPAGRADPWILDLSTKDPVAALHDFVLIRGPEPILGRVRSLSRNHPKPMGLPPFVLTAPYNDATGRELRSGYPGRVVGRLAVPVDGQLELWAQQHLRSPNVDVRREMAQALGFFKSEDNAHSLQHLLQDPAYTIVKEAQYNNGFESRHYPVRAEAYKALESWGVKVVKPAIDESVNKLDDLDMVMWFSDLTDDDLRRLSQAKKLTKLWLVRPAPSLEHLKGICSLTNLTELHLGAMTIRDEDLALLSGLPKLTKLTLEGNPITDTGLKTLAQLKSLESVDVSMTEATKAGLDELRRARPGLSVYPQNPLLPIDIYIRNHDLKGIRRLLDRFPYQIEASSLPFSEPLHTAISVGDYDALKMLLDAGIPATSRQSGRAPALVDAASVPKPDGRIIQLLMSNGADVNTADGSGMTALSAAIAAGNDPLIRLLLACGAVPEQVKAPYTYPPTSLKPSKRVNDFIALRRKPVPLIEQTMTVCDRSVYWLDVFNTVPKADNLDHWSTSPLGPLTGPLALTKSPNGRVILGPFGQQVVKFKTSGLKPHDNLSVEMELCIIGSWDGNGGLGHGPDILDISIPGVGTALHSTFFNNTEEDADGLTMQSFPDTYPFGFHKGHTGASEVGTLGYSEVWDGQTYKRDAIYTVKFTFAHTSSDLEVVISGLTLPEAGIKNLADDERWAIRSFFVKTD